MKRSLFHFPICFAFSICIAWLPCSELLGQKKIDFNRDVRPILSDKCYFCHGPDSEQRQADLRLDVESTAKESAIAAGDADGSELIARVTTDDSDLKMPPASSHKRLSSAEVELLKKWIDQGAEYQEHWAFKKPALPAIPDVDRKNWPTNAIDHFVLRELESRNLAPSPPASRRELIRRVTFDLTGLPPTIKDVDAFLGDDEPGAYGRVVDRLMASPNYGERMAVNWMDAARYGDSSVMHADGPREMWPWRDWVINAYNSNQPFSQFVTEQLAGDLIPDATIQQKIASGFNRNHASSDEGGAVPEELRVDYIVDRVKTTTNVFLGLSFECAQCHDHKYDPISQQEYYQFFAFFNNHADPGFQNRSGNQAPSVALLSLEEETRLRSLRTQHQELCAEFDRADFSQAAETSKEALEWIKSVKTDLPRIPRFDFPWMIGPLAGGNPNDIFNQKIYKPVDAAPDTTERVDSRLWSKQEFWLNHRLNNDVQPHTHSAFIVYQQIDSPAAQTLNVHVGASRKIDGVKVSLNGKVVKAERGKKLEEKDDRTFTIPVALPLRAGVNHLYLQLTTAKDVASTRIVLKVDEEILPVDVAAELQDSDAEASGVCHRHFYRQSSSAANEFINKRAELEKAIEDLVAKKSTTMVMGDRMGDVRPTYVLNRGEYNHPLKNREVSPGVPAALLPLPTGAPANRLGLAQWLVDPNHPLTARVAVNRYWSMFFGQGLVASVMDFGNQGLPPTHAELLDWLARDFCDHDWNVKRSIRQIVTSSTYRQSSRITEQLAKTDLENRWLARGPRFRLMGEFIRDQALSVSGLLVDKIGGPSVKPYQPEGLWNEVALNKGVKFKQDHGEKLYRRTLYTYIKRSAPNPQLTIFDGPTREKCTVQRAQTNTPLAALIPLNDVQFVEASRHLAKRILNEGGDQFESRLTFAFQLCTSRMPTAAEINICRRVFDSQQQSFAENPDDAHHYLGHGESKRDESLDPVEHASWAVIANMILNLDEVLTRG